MVGRDEALYRKNLVRSEGAEDVGYAERFWISMKRYIGPC
jgi:hypothetical protein